MSTQKLLPSRSPTSLGSRFDAMTLENVGDCSVCDDMAEIGQCTPNPPITPSAVFFGHSNNEVGNLRCRQRPSRSSVLAPVVLAGDQSAMPCQQCCRLTIVATCANSLR